MCGLKTAEGFYPSEGEVTAPGKWSESQEGYLLLRGSWRNLQKAVWDVVTCEGSCLSPM